MMKNKISKQGFEKFRLGKSSFLIAFFLFLLFLFLLNACSTDNNQKNGTRNALLKVSVGAMTEPKQAASTLSGDLSSAQTKSLQVAFDQSYTMEFSLQKKIQTLATPPQVPVPAGTYYRVIAYKGSDASAVSSANYVLNQVYSVGNESVPLQLNSGDYYFVCYSYSRTTDNITGDGFDGSKLVVPGNGTTLSPPADVLWYGMHLKLAPGNNDLVINFSHVFSQVQVTLDASAVATNINSCSATLSPGYNATFKLSNGNANPGSATVTQNISWTNPSGKSAASDLSIVYTGGRKPSLTFLKGSISLTVNGKTVTNQSDISFSFSNALQGGYSYTLNAKISNN